MSSEALVLGRYRIVSLVAEGGMGVVQRAKDTKLDRVVALKRLRADTVGDGESRRRLVAEARAAARLRHPNVVTIFEIHDDSVDGEIAISMVFVDGPSLRERLREGPLELDEIPRLARQLASALDAAHGEDLVHRDVKPENVLFDEKGDAILCDFGIVKELASGLEPTLEPGATLLTQGTDVNAVPGTPPYIAPERIKSGLTKPASDQFSLAVTLFEAITGRLPWGGGARLEGHQTFAAILLDELPSAHGLRPAVPEAVDGVLARAAAKEPGLRYPSCGAFAEALIRALHDDGAVVAGESPYGFGTPPSGEVPIEAFRSDTPSSAPVPEGAPTPGQVVPRRWGTRWRWLALVGLAVAGGALVWAAWPQGPVQPVVACPVFRATDARGQPASWLGAAAATEACERIGIRLGGRPETTRIPAELLDFDEPTTDEVLTDPYAVPGVRADSLEAARRSDFIVDGQVRLLRDESFEVRVELSSRGRGAPFAEAEGADADLTHAVEKALRGLEASGGIVRAEALDPEVRDYGGWRDIEASLTALDTIRSIYSGIRAPARCDAARAAGNDLGPGIALLEKTCAMWRVRGGYDPAARFPEPVWPTRQGPALAIKALAGRCDEVCQGELTAMVESDVSPYVRSMLLIALAEGGWHGARAVEIQRLGERALRINPRSEHAHRLVNQSQKESPRTLRRFLSWFPGSIAAYAQAASFALSKGHLEAAGWGLERAYVLGWANGYHGLRYVEYLISRGRDGEAAAVAARYEAGPPWLRLAGAHSRARTRLSAGRWEGIGDMLSGRLLELEEFGYGEQFGDVEALELLRRLLVEVLERPDHGDFAKVTRHLTGDPPHLRTAQRYFQLPLLSWCAWAPDADRATCAQRWAKEAPRAYPAHDACAAGLRGLATGDVPGAAESYWSAHLQGGSSGYLRCDFPSRVLDDMAEAQADPTAREDWFDRANAVDERLASGRDFHGIDPSLVRLAERAHRRAILARVEAQPGRAAKLCEDATAHARRVVDAWDPTEVDLRVPAVPRMRAIVAACRDGLPSILDVPEQAE